MTGVLIDTSIWVDHFRGHNSTLSQLLSLDLAMTHPMVLGELACGTPPDRTRTLADVGSLQSTRQASTQEVMQFVERETLYGLGCGLVDIVLLASALLTPGVELWTLDKRLALLAERFEVRHRPRRH